MDKVHGPINGVNDPGGAIGQLDTLAGSHRLLPDEPVVTGVISSTC